MSSGKNRQKFYYRILCAAALLIAVCVAADLLLGGTLNVRMLILFILLLLVIGGGMLEWRRNNEIIQKQEKEIKLYKLYVQPMEELVKEIRARQHEFDNHINAILNMHLTIDGYDELVEKQSEYIHEIRREGGNQYLPLLRITDKVLAGFLYSKILASPVQIQTDVEVRNWQILSRVSEHDMIEIVGILTDNAYEACEESKGTVKMLLDSREDRLVFQVWNPVEKLSMEQVGSFFQAGYSTKKDDSKKRGIGLYRAKKLIEKNGGEIMVTQEELEGEHYICFTAVI